ncbi:inter-alpha-trypsin inhibitor heavy chain H4-like [Schistocerca serialis cubense]|uniref:inter-alpha-trypsin inhibitor heavy chain H4-like n=1 Tax=Schistocerca serialis cubense TaxID=2023355 RepID=UPI00214E464E|nr:inter-alpha-trypsin inhibitor heavy chain H4-like [Schistocerca serialis cubense]
MCYPLQAEDRADFKAAARDRKSGHGAQVTSGRVNRAFSEDSRGGVREREGEGRGAGGREDLAYISWPAAARPPLAVMLSRAPQLFSIVLVALAASTAADQESTTTPPATTASTTTTPPPPATLVAVAATDGPTPPPLPETTEVEKPLPKPEMYSLHVESRIDYRYARTVFSSRLANPASKAQEVFFSVVLPETAFISGFLIESDGKVYEAYVKEKEEAKKEYQQAVASGQTAAHVAVSARDSNTFTVSVNVEAGSKVTYNLTYEELLTRRLGSYNHVINLQPGQVVRDLQVDVYIQESSNVTTLRVPELRSGNEVEPDEDSKPNALVTVERPTATSAHIHYAPTPEQQLQSGKDGLSGQLVVQYDVDRDPQAGEVLVYEGYFVHFFAPEDLPPLRKHAIFVLDVSGSMEGRKIEQLKEAMTTILDELQPGDYFNIIEFSYSVTVWNLDSTNDSAVYSPYIMYDDSGKQPNAGPTPAFPATKEYIAKAKDIVSKMIAGGGTNIDGALKTALEVTHDGLENVTLEGVRPEPLVVFLTDGEPTVGESRPSKIFAAVSERNEHPAAAIFSLAFGDDADLPFLRRLSLRNAGFARKIYEAADAALQLKHFYKQIASPLLANVTFTYPKGQIEENSTTRDHFPALFRGSELVVAGRLSSANDQKQLTEVSVSGDGAAGEAHFHKLRPLWLVPEPRPDDSPGSKRHAPSLERLWAFLTVQQLLEKVAVAGALDETPVYPWQAPDHDDKKLDNATAAAKAKALKLSLQYSFVTKLTSLVVVKPNQTSNVSESVQPVSSSSGSSNFASPALMLSAFAPDRFGQAGAPGAAVLSGPPSYAFVGAPALGIRPTQVNRPHYSTTIHGPPPPPQPSTTMAAMSTTTHKSTAAPHIIPQEDLMWLKSVKVGNDTINLPNISGSMETYKLAVTEANLEHEVCVGHDPEISSHCRYLKYCALDVFASNLTLYYNTPYFCSINGYAGVCCPDELQVSSTESSVASS